jgi:aminomethyltransferase
MSGTSSLRKTPLHAAHVAGGARMVEFAGWHLPVQYSGVIDEHVAVRTRAGLFDVSHMGEAAVRGAGGLDFLQWVTCNDVARLAPGRAHYTALTTPQGTFVDDLLVYRLGVDDFLLVLNAANTGKDLDWLRRHAADFDVTVEDVSDRWGQMALQGPAALETLRPLAACDLDALRPFRFERAEVCGAECIVSRTGYTGEDGFEIYAPADRAEVLWHELLARGAGLGVVPAGLGARDTLRLEARLALYGNDIDETTTVIEADLAWIVKPGKGEFLGRDLLARQIEEGVSRKLVGFEMRDAAIARPGQRAVRGGAEVGRVTSGTHSPTLRRSIGLVYLPIELTEPGSGFHVDVRGRERAAVVVPTPFYQRPR